MRRTEHSLCGLRPAWRGLATLAALALAGAGGMIRAQGQAPAPRMSGDFDPQKSAPAVAAAPTSGTRAQRAPQALSPRDEGNHWSNTDFAKADPKLPSLIVAGDSTAATGNDPNHRGWGAVLMDYFDPAKVNIVNKAVGGRSFRTFYAEGKWKEIVDNLKAGDYVIIEFGHNDGGAPNGPRSRGDVPGIGEETVAVAGANGTTETVHTFGWYARKFINDTKSKGAFPILSTTTVRNMWSQDDKVERGMGRMLDWAKQVAEQEKVPFLDHSNITADRYEAEGFAAVQKFHPADHTHTSTDGAILNAETLIAGLRGLKDMPLNGFLNDKGQAIKAAEPNANWKTYAPKAPLKGN